MSTDNPLSKPMGPTAVAVPIKQMPPPPPKR